MEVTVASRPDITSLPWNPCRESKICKVISIVEESPVEECVEAVWPETTGASVAASTETCPA